jgi:CHAT domain-containing protein
MPVAKALREAQLALLHSSHDQARPYYWSGFVVTGNFSALR